MAIIRRVTSGAAEILPKPKTQFLTDIDPYADVPFVPALDLPKQSSVTEHEVAAIAQALYILDIENRADASANGWSNFSRLEAVGRRL